MKKFLLTLAARLAGILPTSFKKAIYKIPFLSGIIRQILNKSAPQGLTVISIAAGNGRGLKMALDLQSEKDYWLGTYEPDLQAAARALVQPGMTIYDIGANIGYISITMAALAGPSGKIFSFEALPVNCRRFHENIVLNHLERQVTLVDAAVIDSEKKVIFLSHHSGAMGKALGSAGRNENYQGEIQVQGISIDHFVYADGNPAPDLIKMDIEGGEGIALGGMPKIINKAKSIFLIELHGQVAAQQVWNLLKKESYTFHHMRKGFPPMCTMDDMDWKAYVVAIPQQKTQ